MEDKLAEKLLLSVISDEFRKHEADGQAVEIRRLKTIRWIGLLMLAGAICLICLASGLSSQQDWFPATAAGIALYFAAHAATRKMPRPDVFIGIKVLFLLLQVFLVCILGSSNLVLMLLLLVCALVMKLLYPILYNRDQFILNLAKNEPDTPVSQLVEQEICPSSAGLKEIHQLVAVAMAALALLLAFTKIPAIPRADTPGLIRGETMAVQAYEDGWLIVAASREMTRQKEIVLPETYQGKPIVAIGPDAFARLTKLRSLTIPDTVTMIDKRAFEGCGSLTQVNLPGNLKSVGGGAFRNCDSLVTLTFPESVTAIGGECFQYCNQLEQVILPPGITEIRGNTFEECVCLKSIVIPEGVTRIAAHSFRGCTSLSDVSVPHSVREIGSSAFRGCTSLKTIAIPPFIDVNERAFKESPTHIRYK